MPLILGIDPGSRVTGYGLVNADGRRVSYVGSGCIRTEGSDLNDRLAQIFTRLVEVIAEYKPGEVAIEQVFVAYNVQSALKLGQARGAAIVAAVQFGLPVLEYSARQVKKAVVGYGAAEKQQVQMMIRHLLRMTFFPAADEADALGIAWCHANARQGIRR